jgi:hypothetical protein
LDWLGEEVILSDVELLPLLHGFDLNDKGEKEFIFLKQPSTDLTVSHHHQCGVDVLYPLLQVG